MGASIFRRLESTNSFLESMDSVEEFRFEALKRVKAFVFEGAFSGYSKKDILCKTASWTEDKAAKALGVGVTSVRRLRSQYTADCLSVIGEDAFDKIASGSKEDVIAIVQLCTIYSKSRSAGTSQLFTPELVSLIEKSTLSEDAEFMVGECKQEMTLLHWLSTLKYAELINSVDIDKLWWLLRVLDGKSGTASDRITLLRVLTCDSPEKHCRKEDRHLFIFPPEGLECEDKMMQITEGFADS